VGPMPDLRPNLDSFLFFHVFSNSNFHFKLKFPSCVEFATKSKVQFEHTQNDMNLFIYNLDLG
jgi:hypothetical protein